MKSHRGTKKKWPAAQVSLCEQVGEDRQVLGFIPATLGWSERPKCETGVGQGQTVKHAQQKKMGQSRTKEGALVATQLLKAFTALLTPDSTLQLALTQSCIRDQTQPSLCKKHIHRPTAV